MLNRFLCRITALITVFVLTCVCLTAAADRSGLLRPMHALAVVEIPGIDVSKYQETIDWKAVAQSDVKFAILRCCKVIRAYDDWELDPRFEENYEGAKAAGVAVGCYMYTDAATADEFAEDVEYMLSFLKGKSFEFPVFLDMESASRQEHLAPEVFMPALLSGLELIEDAGHTAGVYSSSAFYRECIDRAQLRELGYPIWEANYFNSVNGLSSPAGHDLSDGATIWQYSGCGHADGIRTTVDRNICYTYQFFNHNAVISNSMLPTGSLHSGSNFTIAGTISSDTVIRTITGAIYDLNGDDAPLQTVTVYPHAREYVLTGFFTKKLVFSTLPEGEYELRITATDASNTDISVVNSPFTVGNPAVTAATDVTKVTDAAAPTIPAETDEQIIDAERQTELHSSAMAVTEATRLTDVTDANADADENDRSEAGFMRFSVWYLDHWSLRSFCARATALGNKLELERTPLYRIVSSMCYAMETSYLAASLRLGMGDA